MRKLLTICFFLCCCQVIVAQSNAAFKQRMQHVIDHGNKSAEQFIKNPTPSAGRTLRSSQKLTRDMQKIHTDRSGSDGGGAVETAADKGRSFLMSNLTLDEYNMLQQMMKAMFMTKTVYDTCNVCHGNKMCPRCGGVQNFNIDADASSLCQLCGGGGLCVRCNGEGIIGSHVVKAFSQEEIDKMSKNCGVINSLAQLRSQYNFSAGQKGGPSIGIDEEGYYFIQNDPSGNANSSGTANYDDGDNSTGYESNNNDNSVSHASTTHDYFGWVLVVGGILTCGIIFLVYLWWRKNM